MGWGLGVREGKGGGIHDGADTAWVAGEPAGFEG